MINPKAQGVSFVVPTLNRGRYLIDTLHDLILQEHRPLEILIVDQSCNEDPAILELTDTHSPLVSYHRVQFRGLPLARNYGWQKAKYEAVIFVDDDIRCGPSLAQEHLSALVRPNVGMVAGGVDERIAAAAAGRHAGRFNAWTATPVRNFDSREQYLVEHVAGSNFSAWRWVLRAAGGFDEALAIGAALYEETELCLRVRERGLHIHFNGAARVQHLAAGSGGCRVDSLPSYMRSLAHNRAILIGRHLRWFQAPVAYVRLALLFVSYAAHYRTVGALVPGLEGLIHGSRDAKQAPTCTFYEVRA